MLLRPTLTWALEQDDGVQGEILYRDRRPWTKVVAASLMDAREWHTVVVRWPTADLMLRLNSESMTRLLDNELLEDYFFWEDPSPFEDGRNWMAPRDTPWIHAVPCKPFEAFYRRNINEPWSSLDPSDFCVHLSYDVDNRVGPRTSGRCVYGTTSDDMYWFAYNIQRRRVSIHGLDKNSAIREHLSETGRLLEADAHHRDDCESMFGEDYASDEYSYAPLGFIVR